MVPTPSGGAWDDTMQKGFVAQKLRCQAALYFLPQTDDEKLKSRQKRQRARGNSEEPTTWDLKQPPEEYAIEVNPASPTALKYMQHMIASCVATHSCCRVLDSDKQGPIRLIDMGSSSHKQPPLIHNTKNQTYDCRSFLLEVSKTCLWHVEHWRDPTVSQHAFHCIQSSH
jgi:hypothetical protein